MSHGALLEKAGGQDKTESVKKPAGSSATMDPGGDPGVLLRHPGTWHVAFVREFSWDGIVPIPHKDWKPAEEQGSVLGNTDFHHGLGPHTHQGGAKCVEHLFQDWPWEGQENPQHVGMGPNLIFRQGASQWDPGGYPVEDAYLWYDRYCKWLQDLLCG